MSEDLPARIDQVMRAAIAGIARWSALEAYRYRVVAVNAMRSMLLQLDTWGARLMNIGSVGDPVPIAETLTVPEAGAFRLGFDLAEKIAMIGGTISPTPNIEDWSIFMENKRVVCGGVCKIVGYDGTVFAVLDYAGEAMMADWWRLVTPDGAPTSVVVNIGPDRDRPIGVSCIGIVAPRLASAGLCPRAKYTVNAGDQTLEYEMPACLAATDGDNTYYVVEGIGWYETISGVTPSVCR